ncbi:MAG: hypothetical protein WCD77_16060, partial [Acidobacteriaceae bacterium]
MEELQSGILMQGTQLHNRHAEVWRAQPLNQRQRKRSAPGKDIALFCPFRHLFSSTYNTAILLRT